MVKSPPFAAIHRLCGELSQAQGSAARVDRLLTDSARQRVLDKDSLLLVLQKVAVTQRDWRTALQVLQSPALRQHRVRVDHNAWKVVERGCPSKESAAAARQVLSTMFGGKPSSPK